MTDKRTREDSATGSIGAQESVSVTPVENEPSKKRRRRILSCDACRRLKCRCELDFGSDTCSRCRNLRIPCLRSDSLDQSYGTQETPHQQDLVKRYQCLSQLSQHFFLTLDSLHQKVLHLESSMQDIRAQLVKLQSGRDSTQQSVLEQSASPQASTNSRVLMDEIEPADQHVHAAPAEVIRRVACQVTGDLRRAFHTKEDVVHMGMLNATTAENLVKS